MSCAPPMLTCLDDEVGEWVVIFPTNVREYEVTDCFPFAGYQVGAVREIE